MNFTPNPTNALSGRIQQQQMHQVPVTTTSAGVAPQSGNLQKNASLPNPSFPINQQTANIQLKVNDDKSQLPPSSGNHQQSAQNNNNHGISGIPQQLINVQQSNMNRNMNIGHQATFQQPPQHLMMTSIGQGGQKVGLFQQMQQMAHQNLQFSQAPTVSQSQQGSVYHSGQQNILQKLQATMPQTVHTTKTAALPTDQSGLSIQQKLQATIPQTIQTIKTVSQQSQLQQTKSVSISSQPPPSVSLQSMQYSPTKSTHPHPQMKTTAKLASPGSQLQSLQKSPTVVNPPQAIGQQAVSQNKTVPSTPPALSPAFSGVPLNATISQSASTVSVTSVKPQTANTPAKHSTVAVSAAQSAAPVSIEPSQPVNVSTKLIAPGAAAQTSIKAVEQPKELNQSIPTQTKTVPKLSTDEKKVTQPQNNSSSVPETNNKIEKSPVALSPSADKQQAAVVSPKATSPSKSTMRLATVTPARQKKQPGTNNNKKTATTTPAVQKVPAKVAPSTAKSTEFTKESTNAKKPQPQASAPVVTTKNNPAPSTSSTSSSASGSATSPKTKRSRVKVQPYQSPTPELALVTKLSTQTAKSNNKNGNDDKLTIFYKNEFLAVRNPDGGFYLCQAMHNVYKSSPKIKIHWLNDKNEGKVSATGGQIYVLDYYDVTDFECVLTTVDLTKVEAKSYELSKEEQARIESILKKAIDVEKGILPRPTVTEENPDGLDLSLYKDEAQLDKISPNKRRLSAESNDYDFDDDEDYEVTPRKRTKVKRETLVKKPVVKKTVVNDESTESDEENLMEIKKKAKRQAASTTPTKPVPAKISEPIPSTSKAATNSAIGRGRKQVVKSPELEVPKKVARTVDNAEVVKESPVVKHTPPKAKQVVTPKAGKKSVPEKSSPLVDDKKSVPEKKPVAEKKPAVKKAEVVKPVATSPKVVEQEKTPVKPTPKKKVTPKAKATPPALVVPEQQPSTSRSRNTRSKK